MPEDITSIKLKFSCQQNWDAMQPADGGKFCDKCNKKVYDFTNSNADEFRKVMAENPGACGKYKTEQVIYAPLTLPRWKKWISAALVLIGFNLAGNKAISQVLSPKDTAQKVANKYDQATVFGGDPNIPAQFPGGFDKFQNYITENLHYKGTAIGRVIIQFMVEADGTITNVNMLRGIKDYKANEEALRIIRMMPIWKPGASDGIHPSRQQYTVHIKIPTK